MNVFKRVLRAIRNTPPAATTPAPAPRPTAQRQALHRAFTTPRRSSTEASALSMIGQYGSSYYDALKNTGDRTPVTVIPQGWMSKYGSGGGDRQLLSSLSRALYENGGYVGYAVNQIAHYSAPICPQAGSVDSAWNALAEDWWEDWCKRADFYNRSEFDFDALQTQLCQGIDLDGDIGAMVTTDVGYPQLQVVEGWRITSGTVPTEGVFDGVKLDLKGRVQGYFLSDGDKSTLVPANAFILLRDPSIVSPLRGLSPLRRGMNDMRDVKDIIGFEKLAVKTNSSLVGVIEGGYLDPAAGFDQTGEDASGNPAEGEPASDASPGEKALSRADMLGGDIPILDEGRKFNRVESNRPNAQFDTFISSLVAQFAAGLGIPPAFFLDQRLTGPNQRAALGKAQRKFDERQEVMCRFVEWVWARVIGWAIANGQLPAVDGWQKVTFQRPAKLSIDAGREAAQDREDTSVGLLTRKDHFGARGRDWERELKQSIHEKDQIITACQSLATKTGVDVTILLAQYGFAKTPQATTGANPDPSTQPPDPDGDPNQD